MAKTKRVRKKRSKVAHQGIGKETLVVHFVDQTNITEIASILLKHLDRAFEESKPFAQAFAEAEEIDPKEFGQQLEIIFSHEEIMELMEIPQGPGIIIGSYLYALKSKEHENEQAALAEQEEGQL